MGSIPIRALLKKFLMSMPPQHGIPAASSNPAGSAIISRQKIHELLMIAQCSVNSGMGTSASTSHITMPERIEPPVEQVFIISRLILILCSLL